MMVVLALVCFVCAVVPAALFTVNLRYYREPSAADGRDLAGVSVLIPARNEAGGIADAVRAVLANRGVELEVVVMDDGSTDGTGGIVVGLAESDSRVRLERAPALPAGWNGKQHACWALAQVAMNPVLCFVDADVRLGPECLARMAGFLEGKSLVSGFPQQVTGTTLEWLLLPLIHFVLLGFLPIARMRKGTDPAFAAGCGQFMMVRAEDYFACGGHSGIKLTMHDGLRLPRLFREAGLRTDLADLTELASCRMYTSARQVWSGLAKNATEGLGDPKRIGPVSVLLVLGQVLPTCIVALGLLIALLAPVWGALLGSLGMDVHVLAPVTLWLSVGLFLGAGVCAWWPRVLGAVRFKQSWRSVVLHPLGILVLLAVQWWALWKKWRGAPVGWRDRVYKADRV